MGIDRLAPVRDVREEAVSFETVRKVFDRHVAVDDLSFRVPRGTIYGLLGPNGAGKTTSMRMLMGILAPDDGRIRILGESPGEAVRERIGYLPEERGLYPTMSVIDNLKFFGSIRGLSVGEARRRATDWLHRVRLGGSATRKLAELSKGNQQKVQFVAAVLHDPDLLVLDEPFTGLDPVNQDLLRALVLELATLGKTVILSTHLMDEVERLCSRIALVSGGRALVEGPLAEVKRRHGSDTLAVDVAGDGAAIESHPDVAEQRRLGNSFEVRLRDGVDPSAWLAEIAARVPVTRFEVRAPSLHSIFVSLVGGDAPASVEPAKSPARAGRASQSVEAP
ncbi:MAG: ATP-binding cassette domain-containing protein [bacterium]